jgi:hypothetical protein
MDIVLICKGQSNSTNVADALTILENAAAIDNLNIYDGQIYAAADPLVGCDYAAAQRGASIGNHFSLVADYLIASGRCRHVLLVRVGVGNTSVSDWRDTLAGPSTRSIALDKNEACLEARLDRIELQMANGRPAAGERDVQTNSRIDIVSGRVTDTQHDYARVSDVLAGLTLRDQPIDAIDHRVGARGQRIWEIAERPQKFHRSSHGVDRNVAVT